MSNPVLRRHNLNRRRPKIDFVRRPIVKRLMQPFRVVELKIGGQLFPRFQDRPIIMKIDFLVLDRPPESFHKDIVKEPATAVHADPDFGFLQKPGKSLACELTSLVRLEDLRLRDPEGILQRLDTKLLLQRDRKSPGQDIAAVPVHHGHEIDEPMSQTDVGDVGGPGLIRMIDRNPFQKIGIDLMVGAREAGTRLRINRLQAHLPHQTADPLRIDRISPRPQPRRHLRHPVKRRFRKLLVDPVHQHQVVGVIPPRFVIQRRAGEPQEFTLP